MRISYYLPIEFSEHIEHTGALCASVNFAKNYKNAFDRLMDTIFVTDVLASQELFEKAISSYFAKIRESVQSLTDDPELYLFGERCRYRRERNEHKQCLQALA